LLKLKINGVNFVVDTITAAKNIVIRENLLVNVLKEMDLGN